MKKRSQSGKAGSTSLISVKSSGYKRPFFYVHGVPGYNLDIYLALACHIDSDRPFYGIHAAGLYGEKVPYTRIEEMAAYYIQEMQSIQSEGPYLIGGVCVGGHIAFEMAQQLKKQGQQVLLVVMVDSPNPFLTELDIKELCSHIFQQMSKWEKELLKKNFKLNQDKNIPQVQQANIEATANYTPQLYLGRIIYFSAQENITGGLHFDPMQQNGWNNFVLDGIEIHKVPGSHFTMHYKPYVQVLAEKLNACLDKADLEEQEPTKTKTEERNYFFQKRIHKELEEKGYAVVDFLSKERVQSLLSVYQKCPLPEDSITEAPYLYRSEISSDILYRQLVNHEIKNTFISKIETLFTDYKIVYCNFISKIPNSPSVSIHQDPSIVDEISHKSFIIWCPLIDVDEQTGCLQVVSKTHLITSNPRPRFVYAGSSCSKHIVSLMQQDYLTTVPMQAGQALVFDARLFHGSSPNLSTNERVVATCHIAPKNSFIHFCYRESQTAEKLEIFEVDDKFYEQYIRGQKPEGFKSLGVLDYKTNPLTPKQLVEFMNTPEPKSNKDTGIKEKFLSFFNLLRGNDWWFYKIPPLLAIAYAEILIQDTPPQQSIITLLALLVSIFFVAGYGHVVNDIFDIEVDSQAGKHNRMAPLSRGQRILLSLGLAIAGAVPWLFIGFNSTSAILLASIYTLLTIYPAPPLRLKEQYLWGAVADAATVHAIPTLLVATVFSSLMATPQSGSYSLAIVATAWAFWVGVRGIILHQIWDRENDLKSGVKTLATKFGVESLRFWINYIVFPLEAILSAVLVLLIYQSAPLLIVPFTVYLLLLFFSTEYDDLDPSPSQKSYVILHDFYEVWLPLSLLTLLSFRQPLFLILLALHIILFYSAIKQRLLVLARSLRLRLKKIINPNAYMQENLENNTDKVQKNQAKNKTFLELPSSKSEISIVKAIEFLEDNQLDDGEFPAEFDQKYENPENREDWNFDSTPFVTSLILYSLHFLRSERKVQEIQDKGIKFLLNEMKVGGLWKYWSAKNEKHTTIPPDLDDICCISYILKMNNIPVPNNIGIILDNRNQERIFYTWVLPRSMKSVALHLMTFGKAISHSDEIWKLTDRDDICSVVNANVLLYLGENRKTRKTIEYLSDIVLRDSEEEHLSFYDHKLSLYYMLSRAYFNGVTSLGVVKIPIVTKILNLQQTDGSFGDELLTALATCALLNFNHVVPSLEKAIAFLFDTQQVDGSWQRIPMYGGQLDQRLFGSAALTTGFCVEALARYRLLNIPGYRQQEEVKIQEVQAQLKVDSELQLQQTKQELTKSQSELYATQTELAQSQSELQTSQTELTQSQSELQTSQTELTQSQSDLQTSQEKLTQSQSELQTSQTELTQLKSYLQQTQGEEGLMSYYRSRIASHPDDIQLYHQALTIKQDDGQIHLQLGNALVRQNRFDDAIATYQTALQFYPNNFEIHLELAKALEKEQKWDDAIASYQSAIELNPDYSWLHKHLGDILAERGQLNDASLSYRRALQLQPRIY
ncbi:MAG: tetratricopeptide repeat protein [Nostoc sp.]|uniref:tetratricopeptide repeat protein n=1 Tax=Nostoc sp. TaxID=1180 RepID=UPI002FFAF5B4